MVHFIIFNLLFVPSTKPFDKGLDTAFSTADKSFSSPDAKRLDLLILDDFLLHTITDEREIKVLFDIMEKRSEASVSTIVCSQREPKSWKSMILNDEVSANSIMKRATKHYTVIINSKGTD